MKEIDVFDFDKTIYEKDSSVELFLFCLKKKKKIIKYIPGIVVLMFFNKLKIIKKERLKQYFFKFLTDFNDMEKIILEFWRHNKKYIREEIIKDSKNYKVVISASPEFLLKDICDELGIEKVIASKVDIKNGEFNTLNCYGKEKVNRLNLEFENEEYQIDKFFSDSYSDRFIANIAKRPFIIKNNRIKKWDLKEKE